MEKGLERTSGCEEKHSRYQSQMPKFQGVRGIRVEFEGMYPIARPAEQSLNQTPNSDPGLGTFEA